MIRIGEEPHMMKEKPATPHSLVTLQEGKLKTIQKVSTCVFQQEAGSTLASNVQNCWEWVLGKAQPSLDSRK